MRFETIDNISSNCFHFDNTPITLPAPPESITLTDDVLADIYGSEYDKEIADYEADQALMLEESGLYDCYE